MAEPYQNIPKPPDNQDKWPWQTPLDPNKLATILNNQWGQSFSGSSSVITPGNDASQTAFAHRSQLPPSNSSKDTTPGSTPPSVASPTVPDSPPMKKRDHLYALPNAESVLDTDLTAQLDKLTIAAIPTPISTVPHPPQTAVIFQPSCVLHRFVRNKHDLSSIVERPERIRAVKTGVALVLANEDRLRSSSPANPLSRLSFPTPTHTPALVTDPAVLTVHGASYPTDFATWCARSANVLASGSPCELPDSVPTGDLFVCPDSLRAVEGALGAVYTAVDRVVGGESSNAFCVVRPPGHHCAMTDPMGFCFVNNVMCGAV
ncbi:hypothetical protein BC938DRAFT_476376 [Jimgerdemannia flammicorona]|uniref:Histone deacetylase domain-containing protein n=1 Tax=Jimgerdemannia flammicorona TaxID=994334 RepID=A0A433PHJ7_9FUNG|nr:hypothetical protein BC938DRAFT_476376 [Jimgerdemannia flammicorona]